MAIPMGTSRHIHIFHIALILTFLALVLVFRGASIGASTKFSVTTSTPADGAVLSGQVPWQVSTYGNTQKVEFFVDGAYKWREWMVPFVYNGDGHTLDTTQLSNGTHVLGVVAYSQRGETATTQVTVTVENGSSPAPAPSPSPSPAPAAPTSSSTPGNSPTEAVTTQTPTSGQTVSGAIPWRVDVSGGKVTRVDFSIDGTGKSSDRKSPYAYNDASGLDTKTLSNGSHSLVATASFAGGKTASSTVTVTVSNATTPPPPGNPPQAVNAPTISGTAAVGQTLAASNGSWSNNPTAYSSAWQRCDASGANCSSISGAGSATYKLADADAGKTLRVAVTASNTSGSAVAVSAPTSVVASAPTPTPSPGTDFDSAIAYTRTPPPFTALRTINVSSQAQLQSAVSNLKPGDYVKATGAFTVSGEFTFSNRLASPAVVDLGTGENAVRFSYTGGQNLPAVWLNNPSNLRIFGGDLTTNKTGGMCLEAQGASHVLWWGFYIHDCGGSGFAAFNNQPVTDNDFYGEITRAGLNHNWDPHAEPGTGVHGAILMDTSSASAFTNNRFALNIHDQPSGAAVELGNPVAAPASGNVLYLKADRLTKVATRQTAGNALQLWGRAQLGLTVKYIEVSNAQGRAVDLQGLSDLAAGASAVKVENGRAANTNLNSQLNEPNRALPWDWRGGVRYGTATPVPDMTP
jgi:hypothetical protein